MDTPQRMVHVGKRSAGLVRRAFFILGAATLYVRDTVYEDVRDMLAHKRLFAGTGLILVGLLSFASDRYCDGSTASYYTCTRPSTYYYYPWWAILAVIIGSFFTVLWFLRRRHP